MVRWGTGRKPRNSSSGPQCSHDSIPKWLGPRLPTQPFLVLKVMSRSQAAPGHLEQPLLRGPGSISHRLPKYHISFQSSSRSKASPCREEVQSGCFLSKADAWSSVTSGPLQQMYLLHPHIRTHNPNAARSKRWPIFKSGWSPTQSTNVRLICACVGGGGGEVTVHTEHVLSRSLQNLMTMGIKDVFPQLAPCFSMNWLR